VLRKLRTLCPANRSFFTPYLRGTAFASLADSLIAGDAAPLLARFGLALTGAERERAEYLASLPVLLVTPPEDGNRKPQAGEKGAKKVRFAKGMLAPPRRRSKAGKALREAARKS
jgi:hypothetical protein